MSHDTSTQNEQWRDIPGAAGRAHAYNRAAEIIRKALGGTNE